ncbi:hypothetical protein [Nannocystis sp.]|uniref:hypothetical protein n=1 Tax=Nannocystis sp. TaxID=1962667 RepID=UPI0025DE2D90|nr:hypothetical protein [Nannocystis sp.]MBK7829721.1 hypothetical protein [Nannocystis sp.]
MRPLFLALLSLAACSRVNSGQPIKYPVVPSAALGTGFSSLSGQTAGKCVVPKPVERVTDRVDGLTEEIVYVHNKQELLRSIGYSGGVSFGLFGVGVNFGAESIDRKFQSRSTSFLVVQARIKTASRTLGKYQLEKHAAETLRRDGPGKFFELCGDGFVAEEEQGGYFLGIIALESVSREEARRLSGSGGVSFLGIGVQGGASSESKNFLERHKARYFVIQEGGAADGAASLQPESSLDVMLQRARRFQETVTTGKAVTTQLIIKPYQMTSNRPRRADPWDLTEQRRFLAQLATRYSELQQADAELMAKLESSTCGREKDKAKVEKLHAEYEVAIRGVKQRAEDCVRDPSSECRERGLGSVDPARHQKMMALCTIQPDRPYVARSGLLGGMASPPAPPSPRPGVDAPCRVWRFASVAAEISPSKPGGAPWDADGSPPETAFALWLGDRRINFPTKSSYSTGGPIEDGLVSAGASVKAALTDRDAMFDDRIADISNTVPEILPEGTLTLESGRTSVTLRGRCIE